MLVELKRARPKREDDTLCRTPWLSKLWCPLAAEPFRATQRLAEHDLTSLRRLLVACHRPCLAISSVEEAQQLLAGHQPSLVLTDYNLGGRWTGIDLLVWMRRSARLGKIPMLLMTGDDPREIRTRLAAAGLGDIEVIAKPFEAGELIEMLAQLRRSQA